MRYLQTYKLFESYDSIQSKVEMCFVGVTDMDIVVKYDGYHINSKSKSDRKNILVVKIGLDDRVTSGEEATSKWKVKYKPVINGKEIAFEISNAIQHCIGYDLDLNWANIRWKNAGEWSKPGKTGLGPGLLEKAFSKNGVTKQFENPDNGNYNLDDLCEFIESKGDMLRQVEIHFIEE